MEPFIFRPATTADIETVHSIIARQNTADYGEPFRTLDSLRDQWTLSGFDLNSDSVLAVTSSGEIAGYGELTDKEDISVYLGGNHQRAEVASILLSRIEQCANAQRSSNEPFMLYGRAVNNNQILRQAFEGSGYTSNLAFLIMEIQLKDAMEAPYWAEGVTVRSFVRGQDEQDVYRVDEEASQDKGYHSPLSFTDWSRRMSLNTGLCDPGLWFLASDGSELAGVCLNFLAKDSNTGWVDHLSVRRSSRKRGIGKALLLHTFNEFYKRGVQTVKLSVDAGSLTNAPHLYESVGMQTIQHYHIYKKQIR